MDPIKLLPRVLHPTERDSEDKFTPWVVTYGPGFEEARDFSQSLNHTLDHSDTWKDRQTQPIKVIFRKAPTLQGMLFKRKKLALSCTEDSAVQSGTQPCGGRGCQMCHLVSRSDCFFRSNKRISGVDGNCKSNNIIYCAVCKLCDKPYVGKTTTPMLLCM